MSRATKPAEYFPCIDAGHTAAVAKLLAAAAISRRRVAYDLARAKVLDTWRRDEAIDSAERNFGYATLLLELARRVNYQRQLYHTAESMTRVAAAWRAVGQDTLRCIFLDRADQLRDRADCLPYPF